MASAYAALMSLLNTMDLVQNHPRLSSSLHKKQIESLSHTLGLLEEFTEGRPPQEDEEALEIQIASAAYAAEDLIESHVVDQIDARSVSLLDLHKVIQDMASIKEKAIQVEEDRWRFQDLHRQPRGPAPIEAYKMIGFKDESTQLIDALTTGRSSRSEIPVFGIGGCGKTTLALYVYHHIRIAPHFDIRAWAVVSSEYIMKDILVHLLSCQQWNPHNEGTERELGHRLYQTLIGRRYLIILDDMWSIDALDRIKLFLPDEKNGSRVIVTTRQSSVAKHLSYPRISMKPLDENTSWNLLSEYVFGDGQLCPPQLEKIGKEIVKQCKGLPLSIIVIARILNESSVEQEHWEHVEQDVNSVLNDVEDGESHDTIIAMSYNYLPVHLKSCFLYMVLIFPEDDDVHVSELVRLWMAEGFLKPKQSLSPEEVAEDYIKDLVDENLIIVRSLRWNGKIKTCCIHHDLRDVCLRIAQKEKLIHVMNEDQRVNIDSQRRFVFHQRIEAEESHRQVLVRSAPLARTLICSGVNLPLKCRLLRILKLRDSIYTDIFQEAIFEQVNLRYLLCSISRLPRSISRLWNLQTLFLRGNDPLVGVPPEIWCIPLLRHVKLPRFCLPDPPRWGEQDEFVLRNLQTLKAVRNFKCTEELCSRIPNIKKLRIEYDDFSSGFSLYNLSQLKKLESLNCRFYGSPNRDDLLQHLTFPSLLQKLTLAHCNLDWEDLTIVGSLLNLKILILLGYSVRGTEWNPVEGEFLALKFLKIVNSNLMYWDADSSHYPSLEYLVLQGLDNLTEIPLNIGDIPVLGTIELDGCSESAAISAARISEIQTSYGNKELQVRIRSRDKAKLQMRLEKEVEMFANTQLKIDAYDSDDSAGSYLTFDAYSSDD